MRVCVCACHTVSQGYSLHVGCSPAGAEWYIVSGHTVDMCNRWPELWHPYHPFHLFFTKGISLVCYQHVNNFMLRVELLLLWVSQINFVWRVIFGHDRILKTSADLNLISAPWEIVKFSIPRYNNSYYFKMLNGAG